jgi:hypothetical protein
LLRGMFSSKMFKFHFFLFKCKKLQLEAPLCALVKPEKDFFFI